MTDLKDLKKQERNIKAKIKTRLKNLKKMEANLSDEEYRKFEGPYWDLEAEVVELGEKLTGVLEQIKEAKEAKEAKEPEEPKKVTAFLAKTVVDGRVQVANLQTQALAEDTFGEGKGFNKKHSEKLIESIQAVFVSEELEPNFNLIVAIYAGAFSNTEGGVVSDGTTLAIATGVDKIDFQDIGEALGYIIEDTDLDYDEDLDAFELASEIYTFYNKK